MPRRQVTSGGHDGHVAIRDAVVRERVREQRAGYHQVLHRRPRETVGHPLPRTTPRASVTATDDLVDAADHGRVLPPQGEPRTHRVGGQAVDDEHVSQCGGGAQHPRSVDHRQRIPP